MNVASIQQFIDELYRNGPAAGLQLIDAIFARGQLTDYYLAYAGQANLYRRLGDNPNAVTAYQRALALVQQEPERRFLNRRLVELGE